MLSIMGSILALYPTAPGSILSFGVRISEKNKIFLDIARRFIDGKLPTTVY